MNEVPYLVGQVDPRSADTPEEFAKKLREIRRLAGDPSLEQMAKKSNRMLARSTMSEVLNGKRLPGMPQLQAFLSVCGVAEQDHAVWLEAWARLDIRHPSIREHPEGPAMSAAAALAGPQDVALEWPGGPVTSIQADRRVMLWGAPASGKSCFLGALNAAVAQAKREWTLVGGDEASAQALAIITASMIHHRKFLMATNSIQAFRWVLSTDAEVVVRKFWRKERRKVPVRFQLTIRDPWGELFHNRYAGFQGGYEIVDDLLDSDGIIYFYDPTMESHHSSYEFFHCMLSELERRYQLDGSKGVTRLPHRLAVCVSKFDEPEVLEAASQGGYLASDPHDRYGFPRVPEDQARAFFEELCQDSPNGNTSLIKHCISRYFKLDRVKYYAISSIGFHLDRTGQFNMEDCYNIVHDQDNYGTPRIRGEICPINILEPLLWLQEPMQAAAN
jgi:hypothetical protein